MAGGMPVLRQHDMLGVPDQLVDQRHDLVAAGHRQRAAGAEIVLQVDDDKRFVGHGASLFVVSSGGSSENAADATGCRNLTRWRPASTSDGVTNACRRGRAQTPALTIPAGLISFAYE